MNLEVSGILGIIWLFVIIWAIVKTAQSGAQPTTKALWIVLLLLLPVLGFILWLFLGPKK